MAPFYTICLLFSAFCDGGINQYGNPPRSPLPPPLPFSSSPFFLASSLHAVTSARFHLGPVPPRHETTRRFDDRTVLLLVACLTTVGHSTASSPNNKGEVSVDPSFFGSKHRGVVYQASGPCHSLPTRSRVFPTDHRPEHHSPGYLVAQVFPAVRPPPQKGTLFADSHLNTLALYLLEGLVAYDMRWSVRCRWREPVIRTRSLRCALWSTTKCSAP